MVAMWSKNGALHYLLAAYGDRLVSATAKVVNIIKTL